MATPQTPPPDQQPEEPGQDKRNGTLTNVVGIMILAVVAAVYIVAMSCIALDWVS